MVGRDVLGAPRTPRRRIRPPQPHPDARERRATRRATIPPGEPPRQDAGRRGRRPLPTWTGRTARPTWAARAARTMRAARTLWTVRTARTVRMARLPARPLPMVGRDVLGAPRRRIRPPQPHPGAWKRRATRRTTIPPEEPPRQDAGRRGRRPLPTWAGRTARTAWTLRKGRPTWWTARLPARPLPMVGRDVLGAPRRRIRPPQPHPGAWKRRATRRATIPPEEPPRQDAGRRGRRPLPTWAGRRTLPTWAARTARPTWTGRTLRQIVRAKGSAITGRRQSTPGRFGGWHCRQGAAQTGGPPRAATAEVRTRRRAARPEATAEVRTRGRAARPTGERRRRQRAAPLRRGNTSRAQSKVSSSSLVSLLPVNSSNSMSARSSCRRRSSSSQTCRCCSIFALFRAAAA